MYGPANEGAVAQWIAEGRVRRDTVLHCHDTNTRCFAWTVSALQPALGLSGAEVAQLMQDVRGIQQAQQPLAAPVAAGSANFIAYRQPQTGMDAGRVNVTAFPVIGSVLLSLFVPLFALIYYGLVHGNLPRRRPDDPSAAKPSASASYRCSTSTGLSFSGFGFAHESMMNRCAWACRPPLRAVW